MAQTIDENLVDEQIKQLFDFDIVYKNNLISCQALDVLVKRGLARRSKGGFNILTIDGYMAALALGCRPGIVAQGDAD